LTLTMVASQAAAIVLSPVLVEIARDFDVSIAVAGQLRAIGAALAGVGALTVGWLAGRIGPRALLSLSLVWLVAAAGLSALSPSFAVLALAQALLGVAIAVSHAGAVSGVSLWIPRNVRTRALSWILPGTAFAWIIGMPIIGLVGEISWRLTWIAVPIAAAIPAFIAVRRLPRIPSPRRELRGELGTLMRDPAVRGWAFGELCSFSAAAGTVVYLGALMIESYGATLRTVGFVLGLAMLAYLPGTLVFRRWIDGSPRLLLIGLGGAGALVVALIGSVRPTLSATAALVVVFMFINAGRTMAGSSFGLDAAPSRSVSVMGIRTAAIQGGYLLGAGIGGIALKLGGYPALGFAFAGLYLLGTVPHLRGLPLTPTDAAAVGDSREQQSE
jgi:predicted MFS family arabinose efflux permease